MYEFALNGPDETLVRVGWPTRLRGTTWTRARSPSRRGSVGANRPDKTAPMTRKDYDAFCGGLPHATHVVQWGDASVWKIGGKVFAIGGWSLGDEFAVSFKCSKTSFAILSELPGVRPAPYLASRGLLWMQRVDMRSFSDHDLKQYIRQSYAMILAALPKKTQEALRARN
jgi:predicted DNA-binding protein (MmcQ/YjbR family)